MHVDSEEEGAGSDRAAHDEQDDWVPPVDVLISEHEQRCQGEGRIKEDEIPECQEDTGREMAAVAMFPALGFLLHLAALAAHRTGDTDTFLIVLDALDRLCDGWVVRRGILLISSRLLACVAAIKAL